MKDKWYKCTLARICTEADILITLASKPASFTKYSPTKPLFCCYSLTRNIPRPSDPNHVTFQKALSLIQWLMRCVEQSKQWISICKNDAKCCRNWWCNVCVQWCFFIFESLEGIMYAFLMFKQSGMGLLERKDIYVFRALIMMKC